MSFTLTFLGSGTSQGVPLIGVEYPPEYLANPKNHRTRPSIHLATDQVHLVVDTTPEFRIQCLREKIRRLDAVLITPSPTPIMSWGWTTAGASAICGRAGRCPSTPTRRPWRRCGGCLCTPSTAGAFPGGILPPDPRVFEGPFTLGDLRVTTAAPAARVVDEPGFLFEQGGVKRLAYLSDCKEVPPAVVELVGGVEVAGHGTPCASNRTRPT